MCTVRLSVSSGLEVGNDFIKEVDNQARHRFFLGAAGIQQLVTHDPSRGHRHPKWIVGSLEFLNLGLNTIE